MQPKWDNDDSSMEDDRDIDSQSDDDATASGRSSPVPEKKKRGRQARLEMKFVNLDGKVFALDQFRSAHPLARACFSNKTKSSGLQTLVWSTPSGVPFLVTGLFAAKLSEKHQVALHSGWLVAVPKGVAILEDRGFRWLQRHYPK